MATAFDLLRIKGAQDKKMTVTTIKIDFLNVARK